MEEWTSLISNVGFPIVIALYTLMRLEKVIKENSTAINELKFAVLNGRR